MRNSSTYVYLAIALGLFCYLALVDKKIPGTKEREAADAELFVFDPNDVNGLEITNSHGFFFFEKKNGHWEIRKPVDTLADSPTIDGIVSQIAYTQPQRVIEIDGGSDKDAANLKEWGLSPAEERAVIHTPTKEFELLVGRKMAINDNVYARGSGRKNEPVRIIPLTVKTLLDKELSDFRSRSVFNFEPAKATKIAARVADTGTTPGQQYEIDQKDGKWTLQLPLVARADNAAVQAVLTKILGLRANDFVNDDASNLSTYGLTSPSATLSVTVGTDEPMVLQLGGLVPNKNDQVYAQVLKSNSVFTLLASSVNAVLRDMPNVRDLHVLPFDVNKATAVSYVFGPKKGDLKFDNGLWSTVGDSAGLADVGKATDLLARLVQLQTTPVLVDSATDLKPYGLDKPQGKITISSPDIKPGPSITLFIGKGQNKLLYVRNSNEPFIYTIPDDSLNFLLPNNMALRDARVLNLKLDKIKDMSITVGAAQAIGLIRSPGGTWSPAGMKDRMVNSTQADTQASLISQLQAKAWLGPVIPAYGLSKPVLTIAVRTDEPQPTVLHIGAKLPDGGYAAIIDGQSTAFELSDADYGILNASSLQLIPKELGTTNAPAATAPSTKSSTNAPSTAPAPAAK